MDNLSFLFAAFAAVWTLFFAYLIALTRRNHALQREIEELRELLEQRQG